jgi:hypothetical protein
MEWNLAESAREVKQRGSITKPCRRNYGGGDVADKSCVFSAAKILKTHAADKEATAMVSTMFYGHSNLWPRS